VKELSSPGNSETLAFLTRDDPTELEGCPGTRDLWLRTLLDRCEPGEPEREDGSFATTILEYRFWVSEAGESDPDCAVFPELTCCQTLWVEVTRLTP
jgi:hypothetical protein